jgi:hypothetical protein
MEEFIAAGKPLPQSNNLDFFKDRVFEEVASSRQFKSRDSSGKRLK